MAEMLSPRTRELLHAFAVSLDRGEAPLSPSWLHEHGVTLDECGNLADLVAYLVMGVTLADNVTIARLVHDGVTALDPSALGAPATGGEHG